MHSRSRLTALLLVALACALGLLGWLLHSSIGEQGLARRGPAGDATSPKSAQAELESTDGALPLPDSVASAPRTLAQGASATPDAPIAPDAEARVEGLVLRPDGKPAALARVQYTLWRPDRGFYDQPEDSTVSDEQGLFTIDPAPAGHLGLVAMHDEFADSKRVEFDLAAGERKRDVRLELREYGRIEGVVLDARDAPRAGVTVVCEQVPSRKALFAESGPSGRFVFPKVVAGSEWLTLRIPQAELDEIRPDAPLLASMLSNGDDRHDVQLAPGQTVEIVLGGIPAGGVRVFGRVSSGKAPLARIRLWAESHVYDGASYPRACTDERGEYELHLAPGEFTFHVMGLAGRLDLMREATIQAKTEERLDFDLPGGSISGRVVDGAGRAVTDVQVSLSVLQLANANASGSFDLWGPRATPDTEGRFAFAQLPAGRYVVLANPISRPDGEAPFGRARSAELELAANGSIGGLEIVLKPGCTLRGVVRGAPEGLARALRVTAYDETGQASTGCRVDPDGSFALRGLAEGSYGLRATGPNLASPVSAPLRVRADREEPVEIVVAPGVVPLVYAKFPAGSQPKSLQLLIKDERGNRLDEITEPFDDPDLPLWGGVVAPGTYAVELSAPDGWHGRETAVLEAGKEGRVDVLLEHAK